MNLYQEEIYRSHLAHGIGGYEWKKHKYIRKEGNRYIYPEDLQTNGRSSGGRSLDQRANGVLGLFKKAGGAFGSSRETARNAVESGKKKAKQAYESGMRKASEGVNNGINSIRKKAKDTKKSFEAGVEEGRQRVKDRKFVSEHQDMPITQRNRQIRNAHQQAVPHSINNERGRITTTKNLELQKQKTAERKAAAERTEQTVGRMQDKAQRIKNQESQIRSAHQGDTKRVKMQIYTDGDRDFDDKNYKDNERVGDTNFFVTKRPDGKYLVLEEDMKWVLDKDTDVEALKKRILAADDYTSRMYDSGHGYNWEDIATQAINGVDFSKKEAKRKNLKYDQKRYNQNASWSGYQEEKKHSRNHASMQDYKEDDPDFDDKNYTDKNRVAGTDFHVAKRPDGKYVVLEEDSKWVLDKKPDADFEKRIKAFDKYLDDMHNAGYNYTYKDWNSWATQAINGVDFSKREVKRRDLDLDKRRHLSDSKYNKNAQLNAAHQNSTWYDKNKPKSYTYRVANGERAKKARQKTRNQKTFK